MLDGHGKQATPSRFWRFNRPSREGGRLPGERFPLYPPSPWKTPQPPRFWRLEDRLEVLDGPADHAAYAGQCLDYWKSIAKAYLAADLDIHVHVRVGASHTHGNAQYLCAHFQGQAKEPRIDPWEGCRLAVRVRADARLDRGGDNDDRLNHAVFVLVPEILQVSDRVVLTASAARRRILPSIARLRLIDECPMFLQNASQLLLLDAVAVPAPPAAAGVTAGESALDARNFAAGPKERQLKHEMIETRPEIVHHVSNKHREPKRRRRDSLNERPHKVLAIRLELGAERCGLDFTGTEIFDLGYQEFEVILSAPELLSSPSERVVVGQPLGSPGAHALPFEEADATQAETDPGTSRADGTDPEGVHRPGAEA
ncbi:MAG: hypothetical protein ABSC56_09590 [Solirubrobacteraceae bacterium]